jgi:hypothetical protein
VRKPPQLLVGFECRKLFGVLCLQPIHRSTRFP